MQIQVYDMRVRESGGYDSTTEKTESSLREVRVVLHTEKSRYREVVLSGRRPFD